MAYGRLTTTPLCFSLCQAVAEEKLLVWEGRLKTLETEAEALKQEHQEEVSEYQEQVKQHAWTIVDLEKRLMVATAQQAEEGSMSEQLGQCGAEGPRPPHLCARGRQFIPRSHLGLPCHSPEPTLGRNGHRDFLGLPQQNSGLLG